MVTHVFDSNRRVCRIARHMFNISDGPDKRIFIFVSTQGEFEVRVSRVSGNTDLGHLGTNLEHGYHIFYEFGLFPEIGSPDTCRSVQDEYDVRWFTAAVIFFTSKHLDKKCRTEDNQIIDLHDVRFQIC